MSRAVGWRSKRTNAGVLTPDRFGRRRRYRCRRWCRVAAAALGRRSWRCGRYCQGVGVGDGGGVLVAQIDLPGRAARAGDGPGVRRFPVAAVTAEYLDDRLRHDRQPTRSGRTSSWVFALYRHRLHHNAEAVGSRPRLDHRQPVSYPRVRVSSFRSSIERSRHDGGRVPFPLARPRRRSRLPLTTVAGSHNLRNVRLCRRSRPHGVAGSGSSQRPVLADERKPVVSPTTSEAPTSRPVGTPCHLVAAACEPLPAGRIVAR